MEAARIGLQYLSISRTVAIAMCAQSLGNVTRCTTPEVPGPSGGPAKVAKKDCIELREKLDPQTSPSGLVSLRRCTSRQKSGFGVCTGVVRNS